MSALASSSSPAASTNPTTGENSKDLMTPRAWLQSTPLVPLCLDSTWFMNPTPMIDPTSECELEFGMPRYQVPKFQMIAAISSAKTIANPAWLPTCRISSTGSNEMIPKATRPLEVSTPIKLNIPDHTTATLGASECV